MATTWLVPVVGLGPPPQAVGEAIGCGLLAKPLAALVVEAEDQVWVGVEHDVHSSPEGTPATCGDCLILTHFRGLTYRPQAPLSP